MTVRVHISHDVLHWLAEQSGRAQDFESAFPAWDAWLSGDRDPTLKQAERLAASAGVPFGYLLLPRPPVLKLPVPDFREGYEGDLRSLSSDLLAVVHQSIRRQDWYRDYAEDSGLPPVEVVGAGQDQPAGAVASAMRGTLGFEVEDRRGTWSAVRRHLLRAFEALGGLTVATSMVDNNTHRLLNADEFRGFTLIDEFAPLVFVNTHQTLNGQLFTLAHEFAHVWLGAGGVSLEDPAWEPQNEVERWCNAVASEFLVPSSDLRQRSAPLAGLDLVALLERLASTYRCGTLVVLQAIHRNEIRAFRDFDAAYRAERERVMKLAEERQQAGGGTFYTSQPYRIGERFSRAVVRDALGGRTTLSEALRLTSLSSLSSFDRYARDLGVA
jgi:Zn-dependent peptidase ImmA (M78 family)